MNLRRRASALLLVAAVVLAACSDSGSKRNGDGATDAPGTGTLRLGIERLKSFDPAQAVPTSQSQLIAADLLFDGLTTVLPGSDDAQPALAESWEPSADLRSWRFKLRSDAQFSNGQPIASSDVKFSLERVAKQGESSVPGIRLEVIAGYREFVSGASPTLAGVKADDPSIVQIDLALPFAMLPKLLASPSYGAVSKQAVETASLEPVTSGPFAHASTEGDVVKLVRRSFGKAKLAAVELHQYDDLAKSYDDFVADKLDWSLVPTAQVDDAASRFGTDAFQPFHAELFYAFNLLDPTFGDLRFRQAIVKAIDRVALVKAVYGGRADPLNGIVAAGVPGHVDDPCGGACSYDPSGAATLLNQAFAGSVIPTVNVDYFDGAEEAAVAGVIETSLTAVGIPVVKRPKPAAEYDQFVVSGQAQLFRLGAVGLYPDAEAYLAPLFVTGSRDNPTGFSNGAFDTLISQARGAVDAKARIAAQQEAEKQLMALMPIVPIAQFRTRAVVASRVHDLTLTVGGTFDAERVTID